MTSMRQWSDNMIRHRFKSIFVATFVICVTHSAVADEMDEVGEFKEELEVLPPAAADLMLSFLPRDVEPRRKFLQAHLYAQVDFFQRSCNLTPIQADKLKLAGRIEIERHFAQIEVYRSRLVSTGMTVMQRREAVQMVHQNPSFIFRENSLCNKVATTILSDEQLSAYHEALKAGDQER